jgi:YHS domain-containing protein
MSIMLQERAGRMARLWGLSVLAAIVVSTETKPVLADESVNTGYFGGVAIMGYDPVAYFTDNRAVKGSEKYTYEWLGTPWQFASREHEEMFKADPIKYAPQYGGYCAAEVVGGSVTVDIDPNAFKIIDGKLYLIYDKPHADDFDAHASENLAAADANWPKVKGRLELDKHF